MATTSKIKKITSIKPVDTTYWSMFRFVVEMENGDTWSILKKNEDSITEWMELNYNIVEKSWFKNIVEVKEKKAGWYNPKTQFIVQAMNGAVQLVSSGKVDTDKLEATFERLYSIMSEQNGK